MKKVNVLLFIFLNLFLYIHLITLFFVFHNNANCNEFGKKNSVEKKTGEKSTSIFKTWQFHNFQIKNSIRQYSLNIKIWTTHCLKMGLIFYSDDEGKSWEANVDVRNTPDKGRTNSALSHIVFGWDQTNIPVYVQIIIQKSKTLFMYRI